MVAVFPLWIMIQRLKTIFINIYLLMLCLIFSLFLFYFHIFYNTHIFSYK